MGTRKGKSSLVAKLYNKNTECIMKYSSSFGKGQVSAVKLPQHNLLRLSPWILVGGAIILGFTLFTMAVLDTHKEKERMEQNFTERAAALIWALEAGSRTRMAMHGGTSYLQLLLEETAKQPGIVYITILDREGKALAHSAPGALEGQNLPLPEIDDLIISPLLNWHVRETAKDMRVFEVYKLFLPARERIHAMHRSGRDHAYSKEDLPELRIILIGLDAKPFEELLDSGARSTMLITLLIGLLAFGGFVSLFWAHNYRLSRRLLQNAQAFASEMVGSLPLGLFTCSASGHIELANAAAARLFDLDHRHMQGLPLQGIGGVDWSKPLASLERGESLLEQELEFCPGAGKLRHVNLSASRIVNENGVFLGFLFIMRDMEEIRQLRQELRRSERLSALGNLAAGVAHEIRNPLSSIKGFAVFIKGKMEQNGLDVMAAASLVQEVDRLNRVVSSLLEFAKPDHIRLKKAPLGPIVTHALRLCASDAASKAIEVNCQLAAELPELMLDEDRLTQALLNLFINAIQATDKGGSLDVNAELDSERKTLLLHIADSGKGMAQEALAYIFDPYVTTKGTGTGLGLAIVHRIVEQHNAKISVSSQPGKGSIFTLAFAVPTAE